MATSSQSTRGGGYGGSEVAIPKSTSGTKPRRQAVNSIRAGPGAYDNFSETVAVLSIREAPISIVLSNPELPDCPIIGVSDGFRNLTGYTRSESVGQNCRFLNDSCPMKACTRHKLRIAVRTGATFVDVLTNRRKDGEKFENVFYMSSLRVGSSLYLVGLQADAGASDIDLLKESHRQDLAMVVDRIFQSNVDVWVSMQNANTGERLRDIAPYVDDTLRPMYDPDLYTLARDEFVGLEKKLSSAETCTRNTFISGSDDDPCEKLSLLRHVSSEPLLCSGKNVLLASEPESEAWNVPEPTPSAEKDVRSMTPDQQNLKSIGSALHPYECTPCSFFCYSMVGCNKAENCEYCHEDHPKKSRRRGKKKRRGDTAQNAELDMSQYPQNDSEEGNDDKPSQQPEAIRVVQQLPASATPNSLVQLLNSLAWLAPLPRVPPGHLVRDRVRSRHEVIMWYNEPSVALEVGQWKQLIPFVSCGDDVFGGDPWTFEVEPELPRDLMLDSRTGVIKGFAHVAHPDTTHVVVARNASVAITMAIRIHVLLSSVK
eukprot:gnl/MRDRNA2_/MRDRNA2_34266_c0_seq1.p1 gnl/MRDRNA2_/MRDRNA2_34266_c0~~gnl/MRDRNA2_/MRDRNA2_34266_c0_seq1.p1  ORF type:complete len:542 (+),score=83.40 gnl/MRDRNA2_/MRDRNA2_34266_c0_seq1:187-1812(+)